MASNSFKKKLVILIAIFIIVSTIMPTINAKTLNLKSSIIANNLKTKNLLEKNPELPENYRNIEFKPGEIIIKFKENSKVSLTTNDNSINSELKSIDELNKKFNVKSFTEISLGKTNDFQSNLYKLILNENNDIFYTITEYNSNPNVEYAEPNYIYHTYNIPNDIFFDEQWALHNNGQYEGTPDADIDAIEAWNIEKGNSNVTIAILDSGVDYSHPDLVKNIWLNEKEISDNDVDDDNNGFVDDIRGWDFANNDNDTADDFGHGTHCAGIVGAVTNNTLGISGVCWNCKIMPIKIGSYSISSDAAANGIKYAADNGADVISMSWCDGVVSQTEGELMIYLEVTYTKIKSKDIPCRTIHNNIIEKLASEFPLLNRLLNRPIFKLLNF
jgi:subtilisin family serine protease